MLRFSMAQEEVTNVLSRDVRFKKLLRPSGVDNYCVYVCVENIPFCVCRCLNDSFQVFLAYLVRDIDHEACRKAIESMAKKLVNACEAILRNNKLRLSHHF